MTREQPSPEARLGKHLLARLRHRLEAEAIDRAIEAGLILDGARTIGAMELRTYSAHAGMIGKSDAELDVAIGRLVSGRTDTAASGNYSTLDFDDGELRLDDDGVLLSCRPDRQPGSPGTGGTGNVAASTATALDQRGVTARLLNRVRKSADRPRAAEVATLLLLARSLAESGVTLEGALSSLRLRQPVITIIEAVAGFEQCLLDLLARGLILPGEVAISNAYELHRDNRVRFTQRERVRWSVLVFPGSRFDPDEVGSADRCVGRAALHDYPILGVAEAEDRLPERLKAAAQLRLSCGPLDMWLIRDVIATVLGKEPEGGISNAACSVLSLSDLAIAIRPGATIAHSLDVLERIAMARRRSIATGEDGDGGAGKSRTTHASNRTSGSGRGDPGSGSEIMQPAVLTGSAEDAFIPRVETLSGYGEAKDWALSLKEDLERWREGALGWEEMSPKLLLSGPPGTGKTIFATALCNTLRIPLIVTSVSTWLEPAHLGDVLRRMKAAFAEAEAQKPAILFIDEIDGIGKRQDSSFEYSDYWNSVVNQCLTLLDGAVKSSGTVVVGATNHPNMIDAALLRSGRLEKHIVIPRPDTEALVGILRHHLKGDLDAVLASAPLRNAGDVEAERRRQTPQPASCELGEPAPSQNPTTLRHSHDAQGESANVEV